MWPLVAILEAILKMWKMPINNYYLQKIDKTSLFTPSIKHEDLFWYYIVSSEINQNVAVEGPD